MPTYSKRSQETPSARARVRKRACSQDIVDILWIPVHRNHVTRFNDYLKSPYLIVLKNNLVDIRRYFDDVIDLLGHDRFLSSDQRVAAIDVENDAGRQLAAKKENIGLGHVRGLRDPARGEAPPHLGPHLLLRGPD